MVVVGLKRPEREDDRRSRWSSLGGAVLVRSTRAGASHGLTDHVPAGRGLLDRVRLERASAHSDPRLHGRAMSARRPGAWAPHPHLRSPSHKAAGGTAWPNGAPHARKRRPRKPVPRPAGWHLGGVGLAQADQVGGDGALRAVPARGCGSNERATGSGPACPYLEEVKLLRRPAPLGSGRAGAGSRPASARPYATARQCRWRPG
jgi:hypothetical protein